MHRRPKNRTGITGMDYSKALKSTGLTFFTAAKLLSVAVGNGRVNETLSLHKAASGTYDLAKSEYSSHLTVIPAKKLSRMRQ